MTTTTQAKTYRSGEVVESLTGHDEAAIEKVFGRSVEDLAENTGSQFLRALLFAVHRHDGMTDANAYKAVMDLTLRDLKTKFATDDEGEDPDLPGSESGKDDS